MWWIKEEWTMGNILELIEEIRQYGVENDVPIMSVETIDTINKIMVSY